MRRSQVALVPWCLSLGLAVGGCGGATPTFVPASSNQQQNVMVIDEGFDLSVGELRGKVVAAFTEDCVDEPTPSPDASGPAAAGDAATDADAASEADAGGDADVATGVDAEGDADAATDADAASDANGAGESDAATHPDAAGNAGDAGDAGPSFDELKQQMIASLSAPDDSCHLTTGISAKPDPLAAIAQYRWRWNAMIRANKTPGQAFTAPEILALQTPIDAELQTFAYHGTATSGTVVHDNPGARLVLVERQLVSDSPDNTFPCLVQSEIDQLVKLLSDPQVNAAYVNQPAQIETELASAQATYDVGLVNESFGASSRAALERAQVASGCPTAIDLSAYFSILNQIALAHAATIGGPAFLTVQAAGNDGEEVDSGADSLACDLGARLSLLVGSYDPGDQARSTFSNFGSCVDVYAPGQSVVAPYAGDWLFFVSGTSFSAPMVARYVSLTTPTPYDPTEARAALLARRQADGDLPIGLFPTDFFYTPGETPTAFIIGGAAARRPAVRPPSRLELHRILRPLSLLRALRGR
jgi:hypothetical protein